MTYLINEDRHEEIIDEEGLGTSLEIVFEEQDSPYQDYVLAGCVGET